MAAIDTIVSLAMLTTDKFSKGTASQNTQFLIPAIREELLFEVNVPKFGKVITYAETEVTYATSGQLVAHATNEFSLTHITRRGKAGGVTAVVLCVIGPPIFRWQEQLACYIQ